MHAQRKEQIAESLRQCRPANDAQSHRTSSRTVGNYSYSNRATLAEVLHPRQVSNDPRRDAATRIIVQPEIDKFEQTAPAA